MTSEDREAAKCMHLSENACICSQAYPPSTSWSRMRRTESSLSRMVLFSTRSLCIHVSNSPTVEK
jgi:hypothetical protein